MKRYLKNLWLAFAGINPYKMELESLRSKNDMLTSISDGYEQQIFHAEQEKEEAEKKVMDYQDLTEYLRKHLADKDVQMDDLKHNYEIAVNTLRMQHVIEREEWKTREQELLEDLDATLEQLQKVNGDIGREMMSTTLLHKTNASLNDLCTAMASGDIEKVKSVVDYLEWNTTMSQIAQHHLDVLLKARV